MDEMRKVQQVGYSTLAVSIPKEFAKRMNLAVGDSVLFTEEADGTLRLIPARSAKRTTKAAIRADQAGSEELLSRLIVGSYALGYDTIEVTTKGPLGRANSDRAISTIRRLRGLEVVETTDNLIVAQSFTDPTKFPVDSLIKRLQILVSRSLDNVIAALDLKKTGSLNDVSGVQDEIEELYWLIVRQLLVALNRRDLAGEIGIDSPLHASGDRVTAKTLDEIGSIILDMAEELARLKSKGTKMEPKVAASIGKLALGAREAFNTTVESLLTPDIKLIERSIALVDETIAMEKRLTYDILESGEYGYVRVLVSQFGQLARYCNIIIEIASHRLLRKTSRVATVERSR